MRLLSGNGARCRTHDFPASGLCHNPQPTVPRHILYYELPYALELFPDGRADEDEALAVSGPDDPLPRWLLEDWPAPEMLARIDRLRVQKERVPA